VRERLELDIMGLESWREKELGLMLQMERERRMVLTRPGSGS